MSEFEELFTDLDAAPEVCAPGYEARRIAAMKRKRPMARASVAKSPFQNASMPNRDIGGIRKFSWETE